MVVPSLREIGISVPSRNNRRNSDLPKGGASVNLADTAYNQI